MFASYQEGFFSLTNGIEEALDSIDDDKDEATQRSLLNQVEIDLGKAESLIRQMNVEARAEGHTSGMKKEIGLCRQRVQSLRQRCSALQQSAASTNLFQRSSGMSSSRPTLTQEARDDRQRFELVTHRMEDSTESLMESRRVLRETEDVAISITENLASNRSLISGARDRLQDTGGMLGNARNILRRMQQNDRRKKIMLYGLILFLVFVVVFIFWSFLR